ncbi:MAG: hydrolase family protein [Nocardia sp.]|uniref:SGNH/GDSL hydrolase family protein n=1 Tax=Nocardia sp. TaxID=1821 RepID=UPI00262EB40B|nr:SGNH/GDSL hydrolase family protein [Nocardia sp.]MCU1641825.1 hydrolase family protein [Nocardia sp.]
MRSLNIAVVMAFGWAALLGGLTAPVAGAETDPGQADSGKSLVVMGDSNTANATLATMQPQPTGVACPHLSTSWPNQLAQRMGLAQNNDFDDVSCVGAYLYRHGDDPYWTALTEARQAAADGAFGARTQAVLLQFGLNDVWGANHNAQSAVVPCLLNILRGCSTADAASDDYPPTPLTGHDYADHLRDIVTYIRYYAPNARIVLVGYQELHTPGDQSICMRILGVPAGIPHAGAVTDAFDSVQQAPRAAAPLLGVEYFDAAAVTAGHGLCSNDPWLNGVLTPGPDFLGQPGHPTVQGDAAVSQALQQYLSAPAPHGANG